MGLGASSEPVVQRWNGVKYEKPYARTRDVLRFVKQALDGEKIDEIFERSKSMASSSRARSGASADPARGTAPGHVAPRRPRGRRRHPQLARGQ